MESQNSTYNLFGERVFTFGHLPDKSSYDSIQWERRTAKITNDKGEVIFELKDAEVPAFWSDLALNVVASKYFYRGGNESSVRDLVKRVVHSIATWGLEDGYFKDQAEADLFEDELAALMLYQYASFNSPVWFNCGIFGKYQTNSTSPGNYVYDPLTRTVFRAKNHYEYPQASACFIQSVADNMDSILDLARSEALLFKYGSGTGTDLSPIRASVEKLSGGGTPSGPMSFLKIYDSIAGVVKSGGKTRRAAKLNCLRVTHPDIMEFIKAKASEEKKAHTLIAGGYPADFNGEAYQTVAYQNVNLSVRITDEFMTAYRTGGKISTRWVTDPKREGPSYLASELLTQMAECAWQCGCPGVQFHDTINKWHTCPNTGPINASNPCSEFMFLDDSACNLASLNLVKFWDVEARTFDFSKFQAAVRLLITAQDILVSHSSYPTPTIAENSHKYRPLGLGHANLGGLLMRLGIAYDSDVGRQLAGMLTAAMHFTAYNQSAVLGKLLGPFEGFARNASAMETVINKHLNAFDTLMANLSEHPVFSSFADDLIKFVGATQWSKPYSGFRNAQVTVLAPTGTIGFMMDCDTTGIEPELGLTKYKTLAGGGTLTIINYGVVSGLMHAFNCDSAKVKPLVDHLNAGGLLEDHSLFRAQPEAIKAIFDCAFQAIPGGRCLGYASHIKMMAAVQPFLSGAISKTVNMPENATVEDVAAAYILAYDLGLKSITVYRDNSKGSQPVSTIKKTTAVEPPPHADEDCRQASKRHRLPNTRQSITHKFDISGHEGYLTVGLYEDGSPGELFITMAKEGSMISGLMDAVGVLVSLGLQHGVPLKSIISKLRHTKFDPSGWVNTPGSIRTCSSVLDYIFKWMDLTFKDKPEPEPPTKSVPLKAVLNGSKPASSSVASYGPPCYVCGCLTVVNGACHKCPNCGESLGCS